MNQHLAWLVERERGGGATPACMSGLGKTGGAECRGDSGAILGTVAVTENSHEPLRPLPIKPTKGIVSVLSGALGGVCGVGCVTTREARQNPCEGEAAAGAPDPLVSGLGKTGEPPQPDCGAQAGGTGEAECWHTRQTEGMSAAEQETLAQRAALLQHTAGLSQCHALLLAARLAERDAEGGWNGLRVCLECRHCHGRRGSWLCGAYRAAGSSTPALGQDFPLTFKRCPAFAPRWGG